MSFQRYFAAALTAVCSLLGTGAVQAQADYPNKPIRLIVPFSPGGPTDVLARVVGERMTDRLKVPVIVENRAGASSIIATEAVAKSAPDGYTFLVGSPATASNIRLFKSLPYDTLADLSPVVQFASTPYFLIVNAKVPANSVGELLQLLKAKPDSVAYASAGAGSPGNLTAELFNMMAGVKMLHVPYRGTGPALIDLVGDQVQLIFAGLPSTAALIDQGKLKVLAVADAQRSEFLPEVPTVAESGVPGFEADSWFGLFARVGTPPEVEAKISSVIADVLAEPAIRERYKGLGAVPVVRSPKEFKEFFHSEVEKWGKVIDTAGVTPE